MPVYESDVCIIGAGITSAMLAEKLSELRPGVSINIVEAGRSIFDLENRYKYRERMMKYGENPWPGDTIEGQAAAGGISRTMAVGGQALHWGGTCNRFSEEDLRLKSMYGLYVDWPMEWAELEKFCCEAERRMGVSGEPSPFDNQLLDFFTLIDILCPAIITIFQWPVPPTYTGTQTPAPFHYDDQGRALIAR